MMEVLENSLRQLRQAEAEKNLRLRSLEILEDVAHWQLMHRYEQVVDEIEKSRLVRAGFKPVETKAKFPWLKILEELLRANQGETPEEEADFDADDDRLDNEAELEEGEEFEPERDNNIPSQQPNDEDEMNEFIFDEYGNFRNDEELDDPTDALFLGQDGEVDNDFFDFGDEVFDDPTDDLFFGQDDNEFDEDEFSDPTDVLFLGQDEQDDDLFAGFDDGFSDGTFNDPTDALFLGQEEDDENVGTFLDEHDLFDPTPNEELFDPTDALYLSQDNENVGGFLEDFFNEEFNSEPDAGQNVVPDNLVMGDGTLYSPEGNPILDPNTGESYPLPPTMFVNDNIQNAQLAAALYATPGAMVHWFNHYGPMDYQRTDGKFNGEYRNVTNYNYGVVSAASGIPLEASLAAAGIFNQILGKPSDDDTDS